ncbi:TetR/AcrR family transcriptional regulator [Rhodobacter calidifons]|uniref:TetR/AcrR family transcriptional regulator n=1 Tax=Rhodobacter calidifons TaxID=2715277 RepID=A0ABX0G9Y9_9RHOB|nr:TetR/AcrR family transcriptional regulator [Rhodobacter calidifons]NHB77722.1 TetR/AcrR family transcriptional regulator [Rhodobacter calidifons]
MQFCDDPKIDPKEAAILQAAFVAFARYGLRRTSMADIAEGAGMSRPALYRHYANKEDIFNALVRMHFQRSERDVAQVLAGDGPPAETLLAAMQAVDGTAVEAMLNSPHADEILSADQPFSQSEVQEAHDRITGHFAAWIARGVAAGRLSLAGLDATPAEIAATLMAAKFGIKAQAKDFADYRAAQARLAAIWARALGS